MAQDFRISGSGEPRSIIFQHKTFLLVLISQSPNLAQTDMIIQIPLVLCLLVYLFRTFEIKVMKSIFILLTSSRYKTRYKSFETPPQELPCCINEKTHIAEFLIS